MNDKQECLCEYCEEEYTIDLMFSATKCIYCEDDEYYAQVRLYYLGLRHMEWKQDNDERRRK